jgi:hypothetical protein
MNTKLRQMLADGAIEVWDGKEWTTATTLGQISRALGVRMAREHPRAMTDHSVGSATPAAAGPLRRWTTRLHRIFTRLDEQ